LSNFTTITCMPEPMADWILDGKLIRIDQDAYFRRRARRRAREIVAYEKKVKG
jgi:hypothetical protein